MVLNTQEEENTVKEEEVTNEDKVNNSTQKNEPIKDIGNKLLVPPFGNDEQGDLASVLPPGSSVDQESLPKKRKKRESSGNKGIEVIVGEEITVIQKNPIDSSTTEESFNVDIEVDQVDIEIAIHSGMPPYFFLIEDSKGNIRYKEKMDANCPCKKTIFPEILLLSAGNYQIKVTDAKKNLSFEKDLTISYLTSFHKQANLLRSHLVFMVCSLLILVLIIGFLLINSKTMIPITRVLSYYYRVRSFFGSQLKSVPEKEPTINILNLPNNEEMSIKKPIK